MSAYVELEATSHFSFLRGASSPEELFAAAALLDMPALGLADRNSVAGVVRAYAGMKATGVRSLPGCRLDLDDDVSVLVYPIDKPAWSRLTRLLTAGKRRGGKGACRLGWDDLAAAGEGQVAILLAGDDRDRTRSHAERLAHDFGDRGWLALSQRRRPGDNLRLADLDALAARAGIGAVVTGDVLYHTPDRRLLQDVVTCIRHGCTIDDAGFRRERHADRHLKSGREMARRFASLPHAVEASAAIADRDESIAKCETPQATLEWLTRERAEWRYPGGVPP
ncbi:MAG: PHP domain-containing protein, partial [Janthinobacterium lividum]